MNLWITGGSLIAVLALAGIARLLTLGGPQQIGDAQDAIDLADALVSGFEGRLALVSSDGTHAVVAAGPGDLVILTPLGARHRADHDRAARMIPSASQIPTPHTPSPTRVMIALSSGKPLEMTVEDAGSAAAFAALLG